MHRTICGRIVSLLLCLLVVLCGCSAKQSAEASLSPIPTATAAAAPTPIPSATEGTIDVAALEAAYLHEPTTEKTFLGDKLEYRRLDAPETARLTKLADTLPAQWFALPTAGSEAAAAQVALAYMTEPLAQAVQNSGVLEALIASAKGSGATISAEPKTGMTDGCVCVIKGADGKELYRVRTVWEVGVAASGLFYETQPQFSPSGTTVEMWMYFLPENGGYTLAGWEEYYQETERLCLYYPQTVMLRDLRGAQTLNFSQDYKSLGDVTVTLEEKEQLLADIHTFIETCFAFKAKGGASAEEITALLAPNAAKEKQAELIARQDAIRSSESQMEVRAIRATALEQANIVTWLERADTGEKALLVQAGFLGQLSGEVSGAPELKAGIWSYTMQIVLVPAQEGYLVADWTLASGEGELDVDFENYTVEDAAQYADKTE